MIERLEVTPGAGTVIRFGHVAAWTSASASANLVGFLADSARNLAPSPVSGEQLADHLAGVLRRRDPEPDVAFAVVGPSEEGWMGLLHGPVQIWDGVRWTAPDPHPGWTRVALAPHPALSVSVSGSGVPPISPDGLFDLEAGVVPGGGFVLLPAVASSRLSAAPFATMVDEPPAPPVAASGEPVVEDVEDPGEDVEETGGGVEEPALANPEPDAGEPAANDAKPDPREPAAHDAKPDPREPAAHDANEPAVKDGGSPVPAAAAPPGVVDLRSAAVLARVVVYPPLPPGGDPPGPLPGAPVVAGVPCRRGHINRPGLSACARCGSAIDAADAYQVSGTRPALGSLVTDTGAVFRLDTGYIVGSDPSRDATVRGRLARPLHLAGPDVAGAHAEIRLHDWDVVVTDRASESGTHVFAPDGGGWERLGAFDPRPLVPGTHIAFGPRIITFLTPWTLPHQETSPRY